MKNVFLKPAAAGAIIRDPKTGQPLAAGGEWKPLDHFWSRRVAQGDVVDATEAQQKKDAEAAAKPAAAVPALAAKADKPDPSTFEPGPSRK